MKIHILPFSTKFQPDKAIHYPAHSDGHEVEQDFFEFLLKNKDLLTDNHLEADWHYLPAYWTRWHVTHDYGQAGLSELQQEVNRQIVDDSRTFTICQYDDGPLVNLGSATVFLASRKSDTGIDIPLLSTPHKKPFFKPSKKYLASFIGRISTHTIRDDMFTELRNRKDVYIFDGHKTTDYFIKQTISSDIALCPRGYGGSSFRFFEAMNLGVPPFLIGDIDTRPFKKWINWDEISFYAKSALELNGILDSISTNELRSMGKRVSAVYKAKFAFQKWCSYVLKELEELK